MGKKDMKQLEYGQNDDVFNNLMNRIDKLEDKVSKIESLNHNFMQ